jgi:hypothetical protein
MFAAVKGTLVIVLALLAAWACGGNSSTPKKPDAAIDAFSSTCGQPGDMGNELGIGKFCNNLQDCQGTPSAQLCSIVGESTTHFCTKTCTSTGSAGQCGTNAMCECNSSNQCGCTPTACL